MLKQIKCPNCGAQLDIPESGNLRFCQFCGSKVEVEKDPIDKVTEAVNDFANNVSKFTVPGAAASVVNNYIDKKHKEQEEEKRRREEQEKWERENPEKAHKRTMKQLLEITVALLLLALVPMLSIFLTGLFH